MKHPPRQVDPKSLTPLQIQLLQSYADGKQLRDLHAVESKEHNALTNHLWHLRQKLGARTMAHAVAIAFRERLIQ